MMLNKMKTMLDTSRLKSDRRARVCVQAPVANADVGLFDGPLLVNFERTLKRAAKWGASPSADFSGAGHTLVFVRRLKTERTPRRRVPRLGPDERR